ncbi:SET domain-containing protein [Paraphaeosphaeria sporulosa]|uniref:SET domain-containing protein n=1 Tax=Paraphaeosphaeria sporulosa TaxID=1460663 RepID=A0A177CZB5_9PLEO|nr:SET domain-containing protein [Paraphaeosphaeria sporulosa]OAG12257.1 SET domain-containing protein [Paraphaeosphaeria sporulosa]
MPSLNQHSQESAQIGDSVDVSPVARLIRWFTANGGELSADVEIGFDASSGYHCRATRNLSSPVVAKCPLSLTLSHLNLDHTQSLVPHVESPLAKCIGRIPNNVLTYLLLVEQRLRTGGSVLKWQPYVACLPEPSAMTTPLWFGPEDMQCLAGTNLARETAVKLDRLTEEWNQANEVMESLDINTNVFSFDWFRWAATIISSRAFISTHIIPDKDTFPILFPVVDILNHSPTAKVEWDFHPFQDFTLKILNHGDVRPGDEVYNNYAPKQNDELLLGYGFCVADNPVEQFAIKMRLPPQIEEAARSMKMFEPVNVPFGMDTSFLAVDPNEEPEYLRPKGHPFGRYENRLPFFRAIPPRIVHMFFIQALMNLQIPPGNIQADSVPSRVVLETLLLTYEAIDNRSQTLPLAPKRQASFSNDKQKYATIYRDGQAKILHSIRAELKAVLDALRFHDGVPTRPVIISSTEALTRLSSDFPSRAEHLQSGLASQYGLDFSTWARYSAEIATLETGQQPAELSVWKLVLCLFLISYEHTEAAASPGRQAYSDWIEYLVEQTPLPTTATVDAEALEGFIRGWEQNRDQVERAYTWADEVVDKYAFPVVEEVEGEEVQRICMYLQLGPGDAGNGDWMFKGL